MRSFIRNVTYHKRMMLCLFNAFLIFTHLIPPSTSAEERVVKVGVYENAPKVFTSESGEPSGIFIDIIEYIAEKEDWDIDYVEGTWAEGLDRLDNGEIDLMPDVAFTEARNRIFSFHTTPVLSSWFQVYARKGNGIKSILDLDGKRISVLERSIQHDSFIKLAEGFGLQINLVLKPDYKTVFEAAANGEADAAITNSFYGVMNAKKYKLEDTAVIFSPSALFFAASKGDPKQLLNTIDLQLIDMKKDTKSIFYSSLRKWTSQDVQFECPGWILSIGMIGVVVLLMSLLGSFVLKRKVNIRTLELRKTNRELEQRITERIQAEGREKLFLRQHNAINRMGLAMGETLELNDLYYIVYQYTSELLDVEAFLISFYDKDEQLIHAGYAIDKGKIFDVENLPPIPLNKEGGSQSEVILTGKPLYLPDYQSTLKKLKTVYTLQDNKELYEGAPQDESDDDIIRSIIIAPMKIKGETIGLMQLQSYKLDAYNQYDVDLLEAIANMASVSIKNARLIDEMRKSAEALRESEEKYRNLIDNVSDIVYYTDTNGKIIHISHQISRYGYSPDEVSKLDDFTAFIAPEDVERVVAEFERTMKTGEGVPSEYRIIDRWGKVHWVEDRNKSVKDQSGSIIGNSGVLRDISDRKQAEETLKKRMEEIDRTNRVFLGREYRIAEIKREVNELLEKLGQPKKYIATDE